MTILNICVLILISKIPQQSVCMQQAIFHRNEQKYLANHVIETKQAGSELECGLYCVADGSCASVNYKTSGIGKGRCELNNKTLHKGSDEGTHNPEFTHLALVKRPTPETVTPLTTCPFQKTADKSSGMPEPLSSCKELLERNMSLSDGVYKLRNNESLEEYHVYCHMTEITGCGSGGWTLVMKIDGNKTQFNYSSPYWTNKKTYAVEAGLECLSEKQSKLASYWNTPFHKICIGMKVNGVTKWTVINQHADSLFNVLADGVFKNTTVGRETWESLMDSSLLEENCNMEGFNLQSKVTYGSYVKVRIGLLANNQNDCETCGSCIGFGTLARSCDGDLTSTSCGISKAGCNGSLNKNKAAFGYILVQ